MKIRKDLVTNSSSLVYLITNKTNEIKTLADFISENPEFKYIFGEHKDTQHKRIIGVYDETIIPTEDDVDVENGCIYIDVDQSIATLVYDEKGSSKSFTWEEAYF